MSKAKGGRPTVMTENTLAKLKEAFLMGCTDEEACAFAEIDPASLYRYQDKNPSYASKKSTWKLNPFLIARTTILKSLTRAKDAQWFMERKKSDEFSSKDSVEVKGKLSFEQLYESIIDKRSETTETSTVSPTPEAGGGGDESSKVQDVSSGKAVREESVGSVPSSEDNTGAKQEGVDSSTNERSDGENLEGSTKVELEGDSAGSEAGVDSAGKLEDRNTAGK